MSSIRSRSRLSGLLIALALAVSACAGSDAVDSADDSPGAAGAAEQTAAPLEASVSNITSETFDLTSYTGDDTLFWFWAPW